MRATADTQVKGQSVPAAARQYAKSLPAPQKASRHLIYRTVTAHSHHDIVIRLPGQLLGVTGMAGKLQLLSRFTQQFDYLCLTAIPRNRIDYEDHYSKIFSVSS